MAAVYLHVTPSQLPSVPYEARYVGRRWWSDGGGTCSHCGQPIRSLVITYCLDKGVSSTSSSENSESEAVTKR